MSVEDVPTVGDAPQGPFVDLAWASEEQLAGDERSRMLFPLRTSVELFSDPTMPGAIARAKQAAILFDEVVFETGLYEVSIAETGSSDWWHPQESLTDEVLAGSRRLQAPGGPFTLSVAVEGSDRAARFIDSPLVAAYASEYHTGILDDLARFEPDWVKVLTLQNRPPTNTPEGKLFRRLSRQDRRDESLMPESRRGGEQFKRNWVINTFNRDLVVASLIGATLNPTSLFAPMVERKQFSACAIKSAPIGAEALRIVIPNVGALPWEAVIEFREHGGSAEARAMLREFEEKAAHEEPEDAQAFLRSVAQDVAGAMAAVAQAQRQRWREKLAAAALGTLVGFEPHIGPIAGPALTAAELGREWLRDRKSWTAAFMVLMKRS